MKITRERLPPSQRDVLAAIEDEVGIVFDGTMHNFRAIGEATGRTTYAVREALYSLQAKGFLRSYRLRESSPGKAPVWRWAVVEGV